MPTKNPKTTPTRKSKAQTAAKLSDAADAAIIQRLERIEQHLSDGTNAEAWNALIAKPIVNPA